MKALGAAIGATLLACSLSSVAQTEVTCGQALDMPLHSRAMLTIDSQPAGLDIIGTDRQTLHVTCTADNIETAQKTRIRFFGLADAGKLTVAGGPSKNSNLHIRIEVPRKTNLRVQMSAGQVKVEEIIGDKDIGLYAGQITISSAHDWDYRCIDTSVNIGQVNAPIYGVNKGGFFNHFKKKDLNGEYRLHAHVTTGQIELLGEEIRARGR